MCSFHSFMHANCTLQQSHFLRSKTAGLFLSPRSLGILAQKTWEIRESVFAILSTMKYSGKSWTGEMQSFSLPRFFAIKHECFIFQSKRVMVGNNNSEFLRCLMQMSFPPLVLSLLKIHITAKSPRIVIARNNTKRNAKIDIPFPFSLSEKYVTFYVSTQDLCKNKPQGNRGEVWDIPEQ